jgi:CubicO group peptidase (beta-lactamase class C family)
MTDVEQRIERVINGLLPETAFQNCFGPPATLAERMMFHKTPGVSIAVVHNYAIEWARGFGLREYETSHTADETTLFQAGSISKPVFGVAVMRLVQEGRLDLDADVNQYLKTWQIPANDSWQPRVTLRQLLSHSAGLTVHGFPGYLRSEALPTVRQILNGEHPANTPAVRVNIIPGTQFRYSGGGTTVAQQLVTDLLGKPFPEIMRKLVLDQLEMQHSTYEQPLPPDWEEHAATAHPWQNRPVEGIWHVYPEMAAAGLWTTPSDLCRLGIALQRALCGDAGGILTRETSEQMLTPGLDEHIGIGFFLHGKGDNMRFGHGGWDEGFIAEATFYKQGGMGAVVMLNSNQGHEMVPEIMRAIAKEYAWPEYFTAKNAVAVSDDLLEAYVSAYKLRDDLQCTVERADSSIALRVGDQPPVRLEPESEMEFFTDVLNTEVTFERSDEGKVKSLILKQDGRRLTAEKQS